MNAYAVIETGGKQYRIKTGDVIKIERLVADVGKEITFQPVCAISDGNELTIGTPHVADATVTAEVLKQIRGPKTISFKKKRRKGYTRKVGHRQELTVVKVKTIQRAV